MYRYAPANPNEGASSAPTGAGGVNMVSGGVYDVSPEWAAVINGAVTGAGGPALVPVDPPEVDKPKPAAVKPVDKPKPAAR